MQRIFILFFLLPTAVFSQNKTELTGEIKAEFRHAYDAYLAHAKGSDALRPITKKGYNEFYKSFMLTPLESYSTLKLMGFEQEALQVKEEVLAKLNFKDYVNVPTTEFGQRVVGSLIAAYQLDGDERFLDLAQDLANRLLVAFNTPTGMPQRLISIGRRASRENQCTPEQVGGLVVEFGLLSKLTNNPIYYQKAKAAALKLWELRSEDDLLGSKIDVEKGKWVNASVNVTRANSGYWAALLKTYLLLGDNDLKAIFQNGMKALQKNVLQENEDQAWFRFARINKLSHNDSLYQYSEIAMSGLLALAGNIELAEKHYNYCNSQIDSLILSPELKDLEKNRWTSKGFGLRSEQCESLFLLHLFTQKEYYTIRAERFFKTQKELCRAENGYTSLKDVMTKKRNDIMPSRLLSQNFKYLYLILEKHNWPLNKIVFSAYGQPLRIVD